MNPMWFGKQKKQKDPKFGVSFALYDGEELLEAAAANIRPHADYINVVYSPESYYGQPGNPAIPVMLKTLEKKGLIDEIITYKPKKFAENRPEKDALEREQRNVGLKAARKAKCDYFMSMDTDEFYDPAAVAKAKMKILRDGITHSFVHILNYGRLPTQLSNSRKWEYYVPFYAKLSSSTKLGEDEDRAPCLCTSMRLPSYSEGAKYYVLEDIFMHHYTRVRKNLADKYEIRKVTDAVDADWINKEGGFIEVPDYFGLGKIVEDK